MFVDSTPRLTQWISDAVRIWASRSWKAKCKQLEKRLDALSRSMAVAEFDPMGRVIYANRNFLNVLGYSHEEVILQHHRMFVLPGYRESSEYSKFWDRLRGGEFYSGEFLRLGKGEKYVWIQATYNPVFNGRGKVERVIKYATDITKVKQAHAIIKSQSDAMNRGFASIEFATDGTILNANSNFLSLFGYSLDEIVGKHHRMFVTTGEAESVEYQRFWERLNLGHYQPGEFHRIGKNGKKLYIQATYNPIFGVDGQVTSVIKYAMDVTEAVQARIRMRADSASVPTASSDRYCMALSGA